MPKYSELTKQEKANEYDKEKNMIMYLSSAYFTDHWAYAKCQDICNFMLDDTKRQFVCGLPYQLSLEEGLLDYDIVEDEMLESDFNEIKFMMEYEALWYGSAEGAFFNFETIAKNRRISYPTLPDNLSAKLNNAAQVKIPIKHQGEIRILSADIALMSSKKHNNDATSIFINQMIPSKSGKFSSNIIYPETCEGLRTDAQALIIRRLFEQYSCDYIVLDTNGIGLGVYDMLASEMVDPDTGEVYSALSCCNNQEMADRCAVPGASKVIWSIKATAQLNSDAAFLLREGFKSGRIRLLIDEIEAEKVLSEIKGYGALSPSDKAKLLLPYVNTTLLINELINLQHEEAGGKIKIYEKSGMRKDRYSSLAYNYYVALQIENKINKRKASNFQASNMFEIKAPNYKGKAVIKGSGKEKKGLW